MCREQEHREIWGTSASMCRLPEQAEYCSGIFWEELHAHREREHASRAELCMIDPLFSPFEGADMTVVDCEHVVYCVWHISGKITTMMRCRMTFDSFLLIFGKQK